MFWAALLHLALLAALLHLSRGDLTSGLATNLIRAGAVLHLGFLAEAIYQVAVGNRMTGWHWWSILLPPMRLGARDHLTHEWLWLPGWNWQRADRRLESRLRRLFGIPLMGLAVLVLPMFIIELYWQEYLQAHPVWQRVLDLLTAVIWSGFVIEFVLLLSLTRRRWIYALRNWIDVVVIALPLLAFLRGARLASLIRLNQVSRTAQVYRLRGVLLRAWRALVALELIEKLVWRDRKTRIARLEEELQEREAELEALRTRLAELRDEWAREQAAQAARRAPERDSGR